MTEEHPASPITALPEGGVTAPRGFTAGATYAGLKTYGEDRLDLALLLSEAPCAGAGVFTQNRVVAAPVLLSREHLGRALPRAILANSGCANAAVGGQGIIDAREMSALAAERLGIAPEEVLVASTGVIGVELSMGLIRSGVRAIEPGDQGHAFARAIMTTDMHPKEAAVRFTLDGAKATLAGTAKGAGMVHPDMATLLAFLTTDAAVEPVFLQEALKQAADQTFNMLTIDGDTSTNDTLLLLANGLAGNPPISGGSQGELFLAALVQVCQELAKMIARDAEGATKLLTVRTEGADTLEDARRAARTIASSTLLKTALFGNDPNWGRVLAALGRSGAVFDEGKVAVYINEICVMDGGKPVPFFREAAVATMQRPEVSILVRLGTGAVSATAWGCDLTEEYVRINSAYTT